MSVCTHRLCNGVESMVLPDDRFKTAQITVGLFLPLARETVEEYALLPRLLTRACASYPDFSALNRRLNELYGASVTGRVTRVGEAQGLIFTAECTADRFALHGEEVSAACAKLPAWSVLQRNSWKFLPLTCQVDRSAVLPLPV